MNNPEMYQDYLNHTDYMCELKQAHRDKWTGQVLTQLICIKLPYVFTLLNYVLNPFCLLS
jgi:hypothetical protein